MHPMSLLCMFTITFFLSVVHCTKYDAKPVYSIPMPVIRAFRSKGFSVSITDSPGITVFTFHGNVNSEIDGQHNHLSKNILQPKYGLWTFTDDTVKLKIGDSINYWLYVEKDGLAYRQEIQQYIVDALHYNHQIMNDMAAENLLMGTTESNLKESTVLSGGIHHYHHYNNDSPSSSSSRCQNENISYELFEKITAQLDDVLMQLQSLHDKTVAPLKFKVEILEELSGDLLKGKYNGTKLLLLGKKLSSDSDANEIIRKVVTDELELQDLSPSVKNCKLVNGSIEFDVNNLIEKHRILTRALNHFNNDKREIVDFDSERKALSNSKVPEIFIRLEMSGDEKVEEKKTEADDQFVFER